jgi:hypothetical protein
MSRYRTHSETCDQIFCPKVVSKSCSLVSVGRPLWREVGSMICYSKSILHVEVEVTLRLTVSQSEQILFPVEMLLSEICGLVSMERLLWREDGSAICSVITQWSESLRTRNHNLLSHLKLPQPGRPRSHIYMPQEQGGPVIKPGTGFPLCRLLRLAGLHWRYSNPPPIWRDRSLYT